VVRSAAVEERLARLAPDQRSAATAPPGPLLCVAPAGSGKTTTLVARIAWLVDGGVAPETITAVTFNKKAAVELAERLDAALEPLGVEAGSVRVRTFHALGREILRDAGVAVDALVDRAEALRRVLGRRPRPPEMRRLDDLFSRLKLDPEAAAGPHGPPAPARPLDPAGAEDPQRVADLATFADYERWLQDHAALDFDDLVRRALGVLRGDERLLHRWRERCQPLLVDEVQDLDRTQLELALLLAAPANDVFLVGDDDQTIYAWRLADVRRVLGLAARLPGLRRIDLVTNYRCPAPVVRRAVRLIEHNAERFPKRILARRAAEGVLLLAADPGDEPARARRLLASWPPDGGGSAAILARTNGELAPYAAAALAMGIAYRAADDGLLLDHPALDLALAAAEVAEADAGAGAAVPLLAVLAAVRRDAPRRAATVSTALLGWAAGLRSVAELRAAVDTARARRAELRRDDARLALATAHGTKGLEFDHVACVGLDEGRFPSARTLEESDDPVRAMEEERRLAYVAWTRARRSLVLVYDAASPSPFLLEAFDPSELAGPAAGAGPPIGVNPRAGPGGRARSAGPGRARAAAAPGSRRSPAAAPRAG
jgi:DNA helicase-2/ATP-dependent DNA helicase PcrA